MSHNPFRIFIGYDTREPISYHVLSHSILTRASKPVSITPLAQSTLRAAGLYTRERLAAESTEFSLTRFLVPYLCGFSGYALFMDCDMLCLTDIHELLNIVDMKSGLAVWCCQHSYTPSTTTKLLNQPQTTYPRKNWSSLMLFDCSHPATKTLTPEYVNKATPLELHRFMWIGMSSVQHEEIGSIPLNWNWLVGEYPPKHKYETLPKIIHYTLGGPWFTHYKECDYNKEWFEEYEKMNYTQQL